MNPNESREKEERIERMFAAIAPRYDLLNSILSLNLHRSWRRRAVRECALSPGDRALDVGAGTLDLSIELARAVGAAGKVTAVDFCVPMLDIGRRKLERLGIQNVSIVLGNVELLPVSEGSFNAAACAFVLRNVADVEKTLAEMTRAVQSGGRVVVLELARPTLPGFRLLYNVYFRRILPFVGGLLNGREAYSYLPASVAAFYSREELSEIMEKVGLSDVRVVNLTGGSAAIHIGTKK